MSLINVTDLTFAYEGSYDNVFEHASFQIDTDWKLGFTGRNGRGKTTFLRLLMGDYHYSGTITANVSFAYFPYPVHDTSADTYAVIDSLIPGFQEWELFREWNVLEVTPDVLYRPFSTLSNGEQTKVLLAALFLRENSYLLIDEPTNHLDMQSRELVAQYLHNKHGFILVSHDRAFLDCCVDHILSIEKTGIVVQKGDFSTWLYHKQLRDNVERSEDERLQKDIRRLQSAAKRSAEWSGKAEKAKNVRNSGLRPDKGYAGHKAAKVMQRAKSIEQRREHAAEQKSRLLKNVEYASELALYPLTYHNARLLEFEDVSIAYADTPVVSHISFAISRGSRTAVTGKNGSGKSSLLKLAAGQPVPHTGVVRIGSGLAISYVSQDTSSLTGSPYDYIRQFNADESLFFTILRKLDFLRVQFEKDMREFSAGQKKKVLIARSLCEQAHLYIWDEPLNYIDVYSRLQIEELLQAYRPTLLFVEHDKAFCDSIATDVIAL